MALDAIAGQLARVDLFADLDDRARERLVSAGATITFPPDKVIVEQGRTDRGLFLLLDGGASVEVNGEHAASFDAGDYFGEMSLLDGFPRSATIRAGATGAKAFAISALAFEPVLADNPEMARHLLVALSRRVRLLEEAQPGPTTC